MSTAQHTTTSATEGHANDDWPTLPPNVTLSELAEWHEITPNKFSTSVELSNALDLLSGYSRGPSSSGLIRIGQSSAVGTKVIVNIVVELEVPGTLSRARVWTISGPVANSGGFAILTQNGLLPPKMTFHIDVEIPATSDGSPSYIKGLRTDMPIVEHKVDDISKTVQFKSISLETLDSPISVKSVSAEQAEFVTANKSIGGSFVVSSSLKIKTVNGPIEAAVCLHDAASGAEFVASTENKPLKASVSLFSDKTGNRGGQFKVTATDNNSPVTLDFPIAPLDSLLTLDANTKNEAATVTLHPIYEGSFQVSVINGTPVLNYDPNIPDPAHQGRVREVQKRQMAGGIQGSVAWISPESSAMGGSVKVGTINSKAVLNLNPLRRP